MVKIQVSFKYSELHVNYFTIFSLITTMSTDFTKSLQNKGIFNVMSTDVMLGGNVLSLYLFLWRHWEMIYDLLFNKFLSGLFNISSFSVSERLHRYEVGSLDLYIPFIFQDISGFNCFILSSNILLMAWCYVCTMVR